MLSNSTFIYKKSARGWEARLQQRPRLHSRFPVPLDQRVPFNVAMPLGLITAELFSNSLKYAHPTGLPAKISVSCKAIAEDGLPALLFEYEDDGVGFPEGFDISNDGSLGMWFIRSLSKQIQGTTKWLSDPLGVHFEVSFRCELPV